MATPWYIRKNDQIVGPFSGQQLRELALATKLRLNDYVRKGEDGEFVPAQQIKELFAPDNLANRPTIPNSGDHFLSTSRDLSPADTSARTVTPPLPSSANPQLTPNGSQPKSSMASEKVKAGLADLVSTAKQAKDLASAHARKTQITQMILPKAYLALGKHVFEKGKYQDQFSELFQRITDTKEEIARIATTNSQRPPATDLKGKLQAGAAHVMAQGQATKLNLRVDSLLKQLGKQAFELHGTSAGPSELVEPITSANEEISRLDDQIEQLSSGDKGPLWQRLPLAVLFTVICWPVGMILVWLNPKLSRKSQLVWTGASIAAFAVLFVIVPKQRDSDAGVNTAIANGSTGGSGDSDRSTQTAKTASAPSVKGRKLNVRIATAGGDRNNENYNSTLNDLSVYAQGESLTIAFRVDVEAWESKGGRLGSNWTFPLRVRLFDQQGTCITHFDTVEVFTPSAQAFGQANAIYLRNKQIAEQRNMSTDRMHKPVFLYSEWNNNSATNTDWNTVAYPISRRFLEFAVSAEVGFLSHKQSGTNSR